MRVNIFAVVSVCAGMVMSSGAVLAAPQVQDNGKTAVVEQKQASKPLRVAPYTKSNRHEERIKPETKPLRVAPFTRTSVKGCTPADAPMAHQLDTPIACL